MWIVHSWHPKVRIISGWGWSAMMWSTVMQSMSTVSGVPGVEHMMTRGPMGG